MASVLDLIKHYQHTIEKYPSDEHKVLKCIDKLFNLAVTVQHLQDTGVGRTVNALRKEPGDVGQAARSLVYKWKLMVAAEESDQETDQNNDTTTQNGHGSGKDSDDNAQSRNKSSERYERSNSVPKPKDHRELNGDSSGSKRKYHSSEDEEHNNKRSKHSSSSEDDFKRKSHSTVKNTETESDSNDDSDGSQSDETDSEMSESSQEDIKVKQEIKKEHSSKHKSSSSSKHSSHNEHEDQRSSSSKKPSEPEKHSRHHTSHSKERHSSEKSSSKEKSHSHDKHKGSNEKGSSSEKKHKVEHASDAEKNHRESKSSGKHNSDKHSSSNKQNNSDKHSSSNKHSSSEHKSSTSQKLDSGSDKQKISSDKHNKLDKHRSSSSTHAPEKEKHKSSSEKESSKHKVKESSSYSSSSKEKHSSSSKEKIKDRSHSKEKSSSHSNEKKHSSSSSDNKSSSGKGHAEDSDKKSKHKSCSSSHKSSKSSSRKNEEVPKKKVQIQNSEDSDDGIDCGSGASFAEALGMISPAKPKKKLLKDAVSPNNDLSAAAMLAPTAKLAPLPALEISALPEISPNYKPRPPPRPLPHFSDEDAMSAVISSKNQRTKVYSGNKVIGKIPTLYEMCVNVLQEHIDALEYTGGVPYEILKPVVDKATPQQLFILEHYNPYLMEDTDHLWQTFCQKHFRNKQRQEMEAWREMYTRCQEEQEIRLKSLTANIKIAQEAKKAPIKQTKMAYVDSIAKPPRNVAKKQAQHGTARMATASPAARVASLASQPNILRGGTAVRPIPTAPSTTSSSLKPKKAPLMAKALQIMRGRKR